ncbi:MAG: DUF5067 domain-containing protein [Oscillospiraceae bacterium]
MSTTTSGLEDFKCPNCGNNIKINSTEMKVVCECCEAEFLVKDFVTAERVNAQDKLKSFGALIDNAITNNDWGTVHKYFEKTCEVEGTPENLAMLNMAAYMSGQLPYSKRLLEGLAFLPVEQRKTYVTYMKNKAVANRDNELKGVAPKSSEYINISGNHHKIILEMDDELAFLAPFACICGETVPAGENECPKCGKSREDTIKEKKKKADDKRLKTTLITIAAVLLFFPVSCTACAACSACINAVNGGTQETTSQVSQTTPKNETTTVAETTTTTAETEPEVKLNTVGDTAETKKYKFTLDEAVNSNVIKGSYDTTAPEGKTYVVLVFEVENISDKDGHINTFYHEAYVDDYSISDTYLIFSDYNMLSGDIAVGKKLRGYVAYEVDENWKELEWTYKDGGSSKDSVTFTIHPEDIK